MCPRLCFLCLTADGAGILTGTRRVLEVFDDYEVSKVVKACKDAEAHVANLRKVTGIDTLIPVMQPAAQSLVAAAQLADRRCAFLTSLATVSLTATRRLQD